MNPEIPEPMRQYNPPQADVTALIALYDAQGFAEVESQANHLLRQFPDAALVWKLLGAALQMQHKDALSALQNAARLLPNDAELHNSLGMALQERGQLEAALDCYRNARRMDPRFFEAHYNIGNVQSELGRLEAAVANYINALKLKPDSAMIYSNLGAVLQELGQIKEALTSCRRALKLDSSLTVVRSNLLGMLNSTSSDTAEQRLEEAMKYGSAVSRKVSAPFAAWRCEESSQRLRVGLVSCDLRNHPVGYFLESLLANLDPARVELFAYPTDDHVDALTMRIRPYFAKWHLLSKLNDADAARTIHADGVHVLLDLSGHTEQNRLPIFAWKPAPVQASWLGYFATTGVAEMDYLLADEMGVPDEQRQYFTEKIWYLPDTRLCFSAPEHDLPVGALPALNNGHITFGCFQRLTKVGGDVLAAWARILGALPNARLRWQCKQLGDPAVAAKFVTRLQQHGIDPARVTMLGEVSREAYLNAHAEVDVILDTFPFPGGTTTCEALWMGVPTLTLAGDTLLARQGASLLKAAGLAEWIATGTDDYIARAVALSGDLSKLAALRAGLREQVRLSPLFDAKRFARNFEDALWGMWEARHGNIAAPPVFPMDRRTE